MKRVLLTIAILFAILTVSCTKEKGQETDSAGNAAGIDVVMTTSQVPWLISDNIKLRWSGVSYGSAQACECLNAADGGYVGKFSDYQSGKKLFAFAADEGDFVNKSSMAFRTEISSLQNGRVEDTFFYSYVAPEQIDAKETDGEVTELQFNAEVKPFFAVVKMTVPSSFGFTQMKVEATSSIAGTVQLCPDKTWGTIGSSGFMYRPTGTHMNQSPSITVSDEGKVLGDEVCIVVLPDAYDSKAENYYCSTESLEFTFTGPAGELSFTKQLGERIYCGEVCDLGNVVTINLALKVQDCTSTPAVVLDSAIVAGSIAHGAKYWFITGKEGFDQMPEPTDSDRLLSSAGITIPVQNKSDRLYVKVLGKCEGCKDMYLKAVVRNWKFDVNYIAPTELVSEYDGLTLNLTSNFSDALCTDGRIGYLGVTKGKAQITPELSGSGWLNANFFSGSYGTTFWMYHNADQLYRVDMPAKTYYSDNDIMQSVRLSELETSDALTCEWSYRLWLRSIILMEQAIYIPEQSEGDASIEDFDGNINYN